MLVNHSLYTWTSQKGASPIELDGGKGAWFRTRDGRQVLDLASVVVNANAGHNHPLILDAMRSQLDTLAVAAPFMSTRIRSRAGADLAAVTPTGLDRFVFTLGGADAIEHAVKIAFQVTGRSKVICRARSYHGATFGALSFSDDPRANAIPVRLPGIVRVKDPDCRRCPWNTTPDVCDRPCSTHVLETLRNEDPGTVAAVLMETVPGTQAGYFPPEDYYGPIRRACDETGTLLILDEVLTGFGRTGTWFATEHYGITPDLMAMGKGITSGHAPLGAVAMSRRVAEYFDDHPLETGMTHTAHPVCLAAAVGNLEAFHREGLVERSRLLGVTLASGLAGLAASCRRIADVRSKGLYGCIEFDGGIDVAALRRRLFEQGVHVLTRGESLFITPPLVISEEELNQGLERVASVAAG